MPADRGIANLNKLRAFIADPRGSESTAEWVAVRIGAYLEACGEAHATRSLTRRRLAYDALVEGLLKRELFVVEPAVTAV